MYSSIQECRLFKCGPIMNCFHNHMFKKADDQLSHLFQMLSKQHTKIKFAYQTVKWYHRTKSAEKRNFNVKISNKMSYKCSRQFDLMIPHKSTKPPPHQRSHDKSLFRWPPPTYPTLTYHENKTSDDWSGRSPPPLTPKHMCMKAISSVCYFRCRLPLRLLFLEVNSS